MQRGFLGGLLGAAAGIAFVSAASAADMPVKAKPVEYVKVCSAYGAGFYYIPGTDICLRVGGWVYVDYSVKATHGTVNIYNNTHPIDADYDYTTWRTAARILLDTRQNTAYGTLRTYAVFGATQATTGTTTSVGYDAAYIQFAGFTWGWTDSFFSFAKPGYNVAPSIATDWTWTNVLAYTAQLGNGLTATVALEDGNRRRSNINGVDSYGGSWAPDVVGNINVTQAWGRAQVMAAVHQLKVGDLGVSAGADGEWGWAVGGGFEIKTPQTGNPNNSFIVEAHYAEGAIGYLGLDAAPAGSTTATINLMHYGNTPISWVSHDAFIAANGVVTQTEGWSAYAAYRHYWTPSLRSAIGVGYFDIDGADATQGNLKALQVIGGTVWSPVAGLDLSLDIMYTDLDQTVGATKTSADLWSGFMRLRRNY